ncbi:hypothetical protein B2I21_36310 [Chryseobacterium mucoviscidosis]|nr:hypothetical protein B2I21_36310 [Chryseobacterium mucoviscidosis]
MEEIRFTAYNAYGEFCFYVTEDQIQEFLIQAGIRLSVDNFKFYYTRNQARSLFDWLKKRNIGQMAK